MLRRFAVVVLVLAFVASACGDDEAAPTTVSPEEQVVFGEGVIPDTFPAKFPIPPNSVVGTTLVDRINHRSEFRLNVASDLETTIRFFQVGLVNSGYVISSSEGSPAEWTMEFSEGELAGTIFLTPQTGGDFTAVVVSMNVS